VLRNVPGQPEYLPVFPPASQPACKINNYKIEENFIVEEIYIYFELLKIRYEITEK
jgi:hypothetical protein